MALAPKKEGALCLAGGGDIGGGRTIVGKVEDINFLLDFYGPLLDEKLLQTLEMYFADDMSLAEIADELGITRQAAQQRVTKGRRQLENFEEKLGLCGRFGEAKEIIAEIQALAAEVAGGSGDESVALKCGEIALAAKKLDGVI